MRFVSPEAWNQEETSDSDDDDLDPRTSRKLSPPKFSTPPPRFGRDKARVAPAPEGLLETENALKRLSKKTNTTT